MKPVDAEIDLHALRPWQVRLKLLPFLDRGFAQQWQRVRIVHGVGEGVVKSRTREILDEVDYIVNYRTAGRYEGGSGATLAFYGSESN